MLSKLIRRQGFTYSLEKKYGIMGFMKSLDAKIFSVSSMIVHSEVLLDLLLRGPLREKSIFLVFHLLRLMVKMSSQHHPESRFINICDHFSRMRLIQMQRFWSGGMIRSFWGLISPLLCLFLIVSWCTEYHDHYTAEHVQYAESSISWSWLRGPNVINILPDPKWIGKIVSQFDTAKKRIWVEIYTWTERDTVDAVIRASRRRVDVRVILEGNVYGTPRINDETYRKLQDADISVVYADNDRYTFTHAKFWIIDDQYCIDTGNLTYSSFQKNRDVILCDNHPTILWTLSQVFLADFIHEIPVFSGSISENFSLSPINMRSHIVRFIDESKRTLYIYIQSLTDVEVLNLLEKKYTSWVDVRVCVSENDDPGILQKYTFQHSTLHAPYLHTKVFMRDHSDMLIGSINLTENALDRNREVSLTYEKISKETERFESLFFHDCFP